MSDNWLPLELPDGSYADDTRPFSQQDVVNYLPTFAEAQGTRSRAKYKTVPGLAHFAHVGDGPHRGARDVEGKLFVVSGRKLYQVSVAGTATEIGTIPGTGKVSMTHNQISGGNQLVIATGDNSYVYNTVTEVLAATGVPLVCVDFLNQRILGVDQARRFWRYSGVATATSWEELDNESAESSPDRIVGGIVSQGEWLVFGERTIEVFSNSPNEATAFVRSQVIEKGCANANTICRLDNSVMWVGNDGIPYRLNGYTPVPIASKAIIDTISSGNPRKLSAFTWEDKGYVCYYVTAQDGYTFGYDVSSGKWHRRESYGFDRWRINTLFKWNNAWYAGDFQNGRMYRLTWGYVYEGCEIMPRKIRTGVMHNNGNRVTLHGFRLDVATGGPASEPDCPDDEVVSTPTLMLLTINSNPDIVPLAYESGALREGVRTSITKSLAYGIATNPAGGGYLVICGGSDTHDPYSFTSPDAAPVIRTNDDDGTAGPCFGAKFSPDGAIVAMARQFAPYITFHSVASGALTAISAATGLANEAKPCWSPDSKYVVAMNSSPRVFKRVGTTITDITATAGVAATGTGNYRATFTPDGAYLILPGLSVTRKFTVYSNNGDDTFTFVRNVEIGSPQSTIREMKFTSDGALLLVGFDGAPRVAAFSHDGAGNFVRLAALSGVPASGQCFSLAISQDDSLLVAGITAGSYLYAWSIDPLAAPSSWVPVAYPGTFSPDSAIYEMGFL